MATNNHKTVKSVEENQLERESQMDDFDDFIETLKDVQTSTNKFNEAICGELVRVFNEVDN